jgi:rhamnogalacturonyl hydrolase YesR
MARGLLSRNLPIAGLALAAAAVLALGQASPDQGRRPSGTPDVPTAGSPVLPHRAAVLAAGQRAFQAWALERPQYNVGPDFNCSEGMECNDCHWTGSTFLLGVMEWHRATADPHALAYAQRWAEYYDYTVCGEKSADSQGPDGLAERQPRLRHNINHQLSGAIYAELSALDNNETHLHSVAELLGAEMADPSTDNFWSWVDAIHMAMNTWARMGNLTGDRRYFAKQFANFNASALTAANGRNKSDTKDPTATAFGFWNASEQLFYRDTRFLGTDVFWSRGNGWALGALVAGLRYGASADPHYGVYLRLFSELAAKLARLQP